MRVVQRGTMKVLPGRMGEAMDLLRQHMAIARRLAPSGIVERGYRPFFAGESVHTIVFEIEWDSMATMEEFFEKLLADPDMQALAPKWEAVAVSHDVELYALTPLP